MATIHLPPDFKEFLKLLNLNGVEYLLIGGYAVGYYGYPRATADMDIWIHVATENAERIMKALATFGLESPQLAANLFLQRDRVIRMGVPPLRIEILTDISGVDFKSCYARRTMPVIDGIEVNIIALNDLKTNKRASGRYKDLDDMDHLP